MNTPRNAFEAYIYPKSSKWIEKANEYDQAIAQSHTAD